MSSLLKVKAKKMKDGQLKPSSEFFSLEHNHRISFTNNEVFDDEKNEHLLPFERGQIVRKLWTDEALKNYTERTGQQSQVKDKHYSYVIDCTKDTTPREIYDSVGQWIEKEFGSRVYNISIHKDEGHIINKNNPKDHRQSGYSLFYDRETGAYYKDKKHTELLAKNLTELKENYEIVKNYHAHIEFSGMRKDGTSIKAFCSGDRKKNNELKKQVLKGLARERQEYQRLDKYHLIGLNKRFLGLLNNELVKNGKEPVKEKFNTDKNRPKIKRVKSLKAFYELERKIGCGEALTENEQKAYNTILEKSNIQAQRLYDKNQELENELNKLQAKKWNKSRAREVFKKFSDEYNLIYDKMGLDKENDDRKRFFSSEAVFVETLDTDKMDFESYTMRNFEIIKELNERLYRLEQEKINRLEQEKNELEQKNVELRNKNDELWEKEMERGRQEFDNTINSYSQNAKDTPKIENIPFEIQIGGEIEKIDLSLETSKKLITRAINYDISNIERHLEAINAKNTLSSAIQNHTSNLKNILERYSKYKENFINIFSKIFKIDFLDFLQKSKNQGRTL